MSFIEGALFPRNYITAYCSLVEIGQLKRGESILIHAAAGGVGHAATSLARMIGAEISATVSTQKKRQHLISNFGLRDDRIFQSRDTSFANDIMVATNGKGADLVLNSLADDSLQASWQCIGKYGRFVEVGKKDLLRNTRLEMAPFIRSATFSHFDLELLANEKPRRIRSLLEDSLKLLRQAEVILPPPITAFSISELEPAFRALASGKIIGKVVIDLSVESLVQAIPVKPKEFHLRHDTSYLIIGGGG